MTYKIYVWIPYMTRKGNFCFCLLFVYWKLGVCVVSDVWSSSGGSRNFHKWGPTDCLRRGSRSRFSDSLYKHCCNQIFSQKWGPGSLPPLNPPLSSLLDYSHSLYIDCRKELTIWCGCLYTAGHWVVTIGYIF